MKKRATQLAAATDLPLLCIVEERVGERKCIGRHRPKAPLPSLLPALHSGARESTRVRVKEPSIAAKCRSEGLKDES